MLRAILKQHLNKAASGDARSATLLFNTLKFQEPEVGDNLGALVQEFRAIHARNMVRDQDGDSQVNTGNPVENDKSKE